MPSKSKKNSKSKGFPTSDAETQSPHSSSSSHSILNPSYNDENDDQQLLRSLEGSSANFPSFIGTSALICHLIEDGIESKGCKIWLSESSMIASSITPGSIVSVSLASLRKDVSCYPLSSLVDECAKHYGFNEKKVNETGNYFVLATVFPSCKVTKNGVRLSSALTSAMGYPVSGRIIFVYPVNNGNNSSISICKCKDLHLSLVSSKSSISTQSNKMSHVGFPFENGNISSPKTPSLTRFKLSSPSSSQPTSPRHTNARSDLSDPPSDSCNIKEVLEDEVGKKLLQTCTMSLLYSRHLICGNLVIIPILSELCLFKVVSAEKVSEHYNNNNNNNNNSEDLERNNGSFLRSSDISERDNVFLVDHGTKVHFFSEKRNFDVHSEDSMDKIVDDIPKLGGLSKEYLVLKDIIVSSSVKNTLSCMGLRPTKGVLLHGPPGTGKTCLARLCAKDAGVNLFSINGPEFVSQIYGESEQALHAVFDSATNAAPAVVFIDELDAIAPSRKEGGEELSARIVATLLNLMDGVSRTEGLLVIAATNRPDSVEPALRRPGRLDREIEIGVPSPSQRYDILLALLNEKEHHLLNKEIHHLAMTTHGFVGADLASLCNEAAFVCLRRCIHKIRNESLFFGSKMKASSDDMNNLHFDNNSEDSCLSNSEVCSGSVENGFIAGNLSVSFEDFEKAKIKVRPSAMREVILEVPKVRWKDVGGQEEVKMQLMEAVEWPQKHQDAFRRIGTRPPTGVLLFGPPGCSKTLLARAVASEAQLNFLAVKGPELFSKWVGESEKAVKSLFAKARANAPSIVFFDELDGLANIRGKENDGVSVADRVMSQLLVELDGLNQRVNVTIIAATNRPDKIDSALLRPGRFDRLVYVGPPNEKDRKEIFSIHLNKMACSSDLCIEELARISEGCTGADISLICREAAVAAIEENRDTSEVRMEHLRFAIEHVQPSDVESYEELIKKFQRRVSTAAP